MKKNIILPALILMGAVSSANAQTDSTRTAVDSTVTRTETVNYTRTDTVSSYNNNRNTSSDKEGVRFGIRAGVNSSNVIKNGSGDVDLSTGAKIGFNAGAFLEIPLITGFSIQPEVQYSQKGFKSSGTYLSNRFENKITTNFIEVPLLAKFKPTRNFAILVGPQFSFLTSTQTKYSVNNASYETKVQQDIDNLRKNILGGVVAIEAMGGPIVFDLRYSLDFQRNNGDGSTTIPNYKNQVISLSAGIRL